MTDQPERNEDRFYAYPMHRMVAVVDDNAALDAALKNLSEAGIDLGEVNVLSGPEGARLLDRRGSGHGLLGRLLRLAQWSASENDALEIHQQALAEGGLVLFVPVRGESRKVRVADTLRAAGGHHLQYFGRWTVEKRWI